MRWRWSFPSNKVKVIFCRRNMDFSDGVNGIVFSRKWLIMVMNCGWFQVWWETSSPTPACCPWTSLPFLEAELNFLYSLDPIPLYDEADVVKAFQPQPPEFVTRVERTSTGSLEKKDRIRNAKWHRDLKVKVWGEKGGLGYSRWPM